MKNLIIITSVLAIAFSLSSCVKSYNCVCTDTWGNKTNNTVNATSKVQARKNCDELGIRRNCELE